MQSEETSGTQQLLVERGWAALPPAKYRMPERSPRLMRRADSAANWQSRTTKIST